MSLVPILGVVGSQVTLPYRSELGCKDMAKIQYQEYVKQTLTFVKLTRVVDEGVTKS